MLSTAQRKKSKKTLLVDNSRRRGYLRPMAEKDSAGAARLRELFPDRGGQTEIVSATGYGRPVVSRWYNGHRRPGLVARAKLQDLYGIGWRLWDEPVRNAA